MAAMLSYDEDDGDDDDGGDGRDDADDDDDGDDDDRISEACWECKRFLLTTPSIRWFFLPLGPVGLWSSPKSNPRGAFEMHGV